MLSGAAADHDSSPGGLSWIVCPDFPLSRMIWRTINEQAPPGWITRKWGSDYSPGMLEIRGTEQIEFKSADRPQSLVGVGLRRLLVNECGIIKEMTWQESLRPTLVDFAAPAVLLGTPKGQNWFYREAMKGSDPERVSNERFGGPSWENPFISESEIAKLAEDMPLRLIRQEIMAEFLTGEGAVFRNVRKLVGPLSSEPTAALGVDLGKRVDFTVLHGLDAAGRTTLWARFKELSWPVQEARIRAAWEKHKPTIYLDSTGVGDGPYDHLSAAGVDVVPVQFTAQMKRQLIEGLAISIDRANAGAEKLVLPDEPILLNELEAFEFTTSQHGNVRYSAPEGLHDDAVIALALATYGLKAGALRPVWRAY